MKIKLTWKEWKRFLNRILLANKRSCWEWQGARTDDGYGVFPVQGIVILAHRLAFILHYKRDPGKLLVLHECDNPACVNPRHLFVGTSEDNNEDRHKKGRSKGAKGESNIHAKLTEKKVREIKRKLARGIQKRQLARRYKVSQSTIGKIEHGRIWKHVR